MTVDFESLATLLPIVFTALFAIAFAIGLTQQWATSRKQVRATDAPSAPARGGQPDGSGRDLR
ncbi:hypothetical protein [Amycolatopsis nalaikhensis]|uniref:Uncharacterized protein n=1 Tax=Amycolatopsis nalaikhensis TaxID=715472 RepID=A0ABY8XY82_9PSEU|nr:hypothetical protein [Amycolatopsis sp. 2-2]WIV60690.1 hypothetical protein QP939_19790 [Amycolatopsis sp. 2-2]